MDLSDNYTRLYVFGTIPQVNRTRKQNSFIALLGSRKGLVDRTSVTFKILATVVQSNIETMTN